MSRAYNARRKTKRQEARVAAEPARPHRSSPLRWRTLVPAVVIVGILAVVGILGFGNSNGISKAQVDREVTVLLAGIHQRGTTLGSPRAPIVMQVFADLECPTVRLFVENYLPSIIERWVRPGVVRLDYRSFETDTSNEEVFFKQEMAALAAGRQAKLWNFVLTAVREQGEPRTNYVTSQFLDDIASQVPALKQSKWHDDKADARLSKRVALSVISGRTQGIRSTPGLVIAFTHNKVDPGIGSASTRKRFEASLAGDIRSMQKEAREDFPTLRTTKSNLLKG